MIIKLKSSNKRVSLYKSKDALLVYSFISYNLYGFKNLYAAIFLLMEEKNSIDLVKKELEKLGINSSSYNDLLIAIDKILKGKDKSNLDTNSTENLIFKEDKTVDINEDIYLFNGWYFTISDNLGVQKELQAIAHLKTDSLYWQKVTKVTINKDYSIEVNSKYIDKISKKEHLIPYLYGLLRTIYITKIDFLITLHAASLKYKNRVLIMPAKSGKGKSTLSMFLTNSGFEVFSDELTIIKTNSHIIPIKLGIGLKESSWNLFDSIKDKLAKSPTHLRYDNQKVKYILPKFADSESLAYNATFIFPNYQKGAKSDIKEIDIVDALSYIIETQYYFSDIKDVTKIEQWLDILSSCSLYTLTYSNLDDAKKIIKKVMKHEKL